MTLPIDPNYAALTLGTLAATLPGASAVLRRHHLDYCADGSLPLHVAAGLAGCDVDALVAELTLLETAPPGMPNDTGALIDWILQRFHAKHREELEEIAALMKRVEAQHGGDRDLPPALPRLVADIAANLESHMQREEQVLFLMMLAGGHPMIVSPITVMQMEHDDHIANLRKLATLTQDFTPPPSACATWRALYTGLAKLAADVTEHIRVENEVLFARFG